MYRPENKKRGITELLCVTVVQRRRCWFSRFIQGVFGDFIKDLRVAYTQNRTSNKGIEVQTHYKVKRIGPGPKAYVFDLKDEEGLAAGIKLSGILNILKRERRDTKENDLHKSLMTLYPSRVGLSGRHSKKICISGPQPRKHRRNVRKKQNVGGSTRRI